MKRLKRTSYYDKNRSSYLDEQNQEYVYEFISYDECGRQIPIRQTIAITEENVEIIKMLDQYDHKEDLQNLYQSRHHDKFIKNETNNGDDTDFKCTRFENLEDKRADIYSILFDSVEIDESRYDAFLSMLNANQRDLIFEHINMGKTLPQMSKEQGVSVKALEDRWARLRIKAKKFFKKQV